MRNKTSWAWVYNVVLPQSQTSPLNFAPTDTDPDIPASSPNSIMKLEVSNYENTQYKRLRITSCTSSPKDAISISIAFSPSLKNDNGYQFYMHQSMPEISRHHWHLHTYNYWQEQILITSNFKKDCRALISTKEPITNGTNIRVWPLWVSGKGIHTTRWLPSCIIYKTVFPKVVMPDSFCTQIYQECLRII